MDHQKIFQQVIAIPWNLIKQINEVDKGNTNPEFILQCSSEIQQNPVQNCLSRLGQHQSCLFFWKLKKKTNYKNQFNDEISMVWSFLSKVKFHGLHGPPWETGGIRADLKILAL